MNDQPERHADMLAGFYLRLVDAGVDGDVAGVLTIDLNKGVIAGSVDVPAESKEAQKEALRQAAEAKAEKRRRRLTANGEK